ncbi:T9SS type A sorting domain-containing protein [candidate division KSB1 bacterium]|nr:T9SS type A sorting domain-containing protein [candidate division KSB1 bacterium]
MNRMGYGFLIIWVMAIGLAQAADDWTQKSPSPNPGLRSQHALCYVGSDRVVVFGGLVSAVNAETWVYDIGSDAWLNRNPSAPPAARNLHAMAYIGGDQAVLFGGSDGSDRNDTWEYDFSLNNWVDTNPTTKPSARQRHAMAFIGGNKVLMFGGSVSGSFNNETWLYDGSANSWTQLSLSTQPSGREGHAMAYIGGDRVLLFGGFDGDAYLDDTWVFDLSDNSWTQKTPATRPSMRTTHAMAYMGDDKVFLFGGNTGFLDNESWVYDLSANIWVKDLNGSNPSGRTFHGLAETSLDGSSYLVLYGGITSNGNNSETWTFGGGDYSLPVELESFAAHASDGRVRLVWRTQNEIECAGFNLYRSSVYDGARARINPRLIEGAGTSTRPNDYAYVDSDVSNGSTYYYWLEDQSFSGTTALHGPVEATPLLTPGAKPPDMFALHPNFPNPFNPGTWFAYDLPEAAEVELAVFTLLGTRVRLLVQDYQQADTYSVYWNGTDTAGADLPSGVYLVQLKTPTQAQLRKVTLIK